MGNYEEADEAAGATLVGMFGGDAGVAAGMALGRMIGGDTGLVLGEATNAILPGAGLVLGPVLGVAGGLLGSWIGAEGGKWIYKHEYPSLSGTNQKFIPMPPIPRD